MRDLKRSGVPASSSTPHEARAEERQFHVLFQSADGQRGRVVGAAIRVLVLRRRFANAPGRTPPSAGLYGVVRYHHTVRDAGAKSKEEGTPVHLLSREPRANARQRSPEARGSTRRQWNPHRVQVSGHRPIRAGHLDHLVIQAQEEEGRRRLADEQALVLLPENWKSSEPTIEAPAAHKNRSEGSLAVCCSMVLATAPSECCCASLYGPVCRARVIVSVAITISSFGTSGSPPLPHSGSGDQKGSAKTVPQHDDTGMMEAEPRA